MLENTTSFRYDVLINKYINTLLTIVIEMLKVC